MADSLADFERKLRDLEKGMTTRQAMGRVGSAVQGEIDNAVRGTLRDLSMSGWPGDIVGSHRVLDDESVLVQPVKAMKGRMAVLERGRNRGNAGGLAGPGISADGTTRRNANGAVRRVRARRGRRWNGYTQPQGTMTDASQRIADKAPPLIAVEVRRAIVKHIGGS